VGTALREESKASARRSCQAHTTTRDNFILKPSRFSAVLTLISGLAQRSESSVELHNRIGCGNRAVNNEIVTSDRRRWQYLVRGIVPLSLDDARPARPTIRTCPKDESFGK
jgi:hypothetical protein